MLPFCVTLLFFLFLLVVPGNFRQGLAPKTTRFWGVSSTSVWGMTWIVLVSYDCTFVWACVRIHKMNESCSKTETQFYACLSSQIKFEVDIYRSQYMVGWSGGKQASIVCNSLQWNLLQGIPLKCRHVYDTLTERVVKILEKVTCP